MDPHLEMWIHVRGTSHVAVRTLMPRRPCGEAPPGAPGPPRARGKNRKPYVSRARLNGRVWFPGRLSDPSDLFWGMWSCGCFPALPVQSSVPNQVPGFASLVFALSALEVGPTVVGSRFVRLRASGARRQEFGGDPRALSPGCGRNKCRNHKGRLL